MKMIVVYVMLLEGKLVRWAGPALLAFSLLSPATASDSTGAQQRLAVMGIDVNAARLIQFAAQGDVMVVDLLLSAGLSVNADEPSRQVTALHNAAAQGHLRLVGLLVERGAGVNPVDWRGNTPLINAAYFGRTEVVRRLLAHGADVSHVSKDGNTALIAAVLSGNPSTVKLLVAAGFDLSLIPDGTLAKAVAGRLQQVPMVIDKLPSSYAP